jgi:hypothetical protein
LLSPREIDDDQAMRDLKKFEIVLQSHPRCQQEEFWKVSRFRVIVGESFGRRG